jgi:hypothetical protein
MAGELTTGDQFESNADSSPTGMNS